MDYQVSLLIAQKKKAVFGGDHYMLNKIFSKLNIDMDKEARKVGFHVENTYSNKKSR